MALQLFNRGVSLLSNFFRAAYGQKKKKITATQVLVNKSTKTIQSKWIGFVTARGAYISKYKATSFCIPPTPPAHFSLEESFVPAAGQATFLLFM